MILFSELYALGALITMALFLYAKDMDIEINGYKMTSWRFVGFTIIASILWPITMIMVLIFGHVNPEEE